MNHDPMCNWAGQPKKPTPVLGCECALIARVRGDERERLVRTYSGSAAYAAIAAERDAARAEVAALRERLNCEACLVSAPDPCPWHQAAGGTTA